MSNFHFIYNCYNIVCILCLISTVLNSMFRVYSCIKFIDKDVQHKVLVEEKAS